MRLNELMEERNITQIQLADTLHLRPSRICGWVGGRSLPNAEAAAILADFFEVSVEYLLGKSDSRTKNATARDGLSPIEKQLISLPPEQQAEALAYIQWRVQWQNTPEGQQ